MLVKAEFVQDLGEDSIDYCYLFTVSEDDLKLMELDGVRFWDPKFARTKIQRALCGDLYSEIVDIHRRGIVVKLPYRPDAFENSEPYPGQLRRLQCGQTYWVMLRGPFQRNDVYSHKIGRQPLTHTIFEGAGIYPYLKDTQAVQETLAELELLPQSFFSLSAMQALGDSFISQLQSLVQHEEIRKRLEVVMRLWGFCVNPCLTPAMLSQGELLYGKSSEISLSHIYKLFAQTTSEARNAHHPSGSPIFNIVCELSNPQEFGAMGTLLPIAMISNPYSFVGPCSNPGISSASGANATTKLFPFWIMDILARSLYKLDYRYPDRTNAMIHEAVRHLELRNHQAFITHTASQPTWKETFNFDKDGIVPNGSTIFSKTILQSGVIRRSRELELVRRGAIKQVYISEGTYPNPYRAIAGFAGCVLDTIGNNEQIASGIDSISTLVTKVDIEDREKVYQWRGLKHRIRTIEEISDLVLREGLRFDGNNILPVSPPSTDKNNAAQKTLTPSQAEASRMIIRWRISCVTGNPGTGKSYLLHELDRFSRELSKAGQNTYLLILTPTNKASSRICELFPPQETYKFGGSAIEADGSDSLPVSFRVAVGTIDSYLGKLKTSQRLREELRSRSGIVALDECSMVTEEKFREILDFYIDPETNSLSDRLKRLVLVGDPYQLLSVEPGNFYADMLKFLPCTQLREQMRYGGSDPNKISFETLFNSVRIGMTNEEYRKKVVETLLTINKNPQLADENIKVHLLDDIPTVKPPIEHPEQFWERFVQDLADETRNIILKEIMDWNHASLLGGGFSPRISLRGTLEDKKVSTKDYRTFHDCFTNEDNRFQIITLVRKPRSASGQTEYISSSERINGWIHDALLGRLPQDFGFKSFVPPTGNPIIPIGNNKIWYPSKNGELLPYEDVLKRFSRSREINQFLNHYRPDNLILSKGWPYIILKNQFKRYGVFRGDTIRFQGVTPKKNKNYYRFTTEDNNKRDLLISARYCTSQYISYGWASNVHQTQGSEYPLVILCWLDGICFPFLTSHWENAVTRTNEETMKPLAEVKFGGFNIGNELASLDDKLDSRAFYTGITRTSVKVVEEQNVISEDESTTTLKKIGRCVIVAGKHALRRYLSLKVHDRKTPLFGMLWEKLSNAK